MKNSQDNNLGEIESILVNKNQLTLKLNDVSNHIMSFKLQINI